MTVSKKIVLATLIVVAGYGLAALCGAPARVLLRTHPQTGLTPEVSTATAEPKALNSPPPGHWALDSARLVPDTGPIQSNRGTTPHAPIVSNPVEPRLLTLEPVSSPPPADDSVTPIASAQPSASAHRRPQAILRNEAPRALVVEPAPPIVVKSIQPIAPPATIDHPVQQTHLLSAPSVTSYETARLPVPGPETITPQPYPPAEEIREPRRHIIVDGDSLARLAGRYLNDPHRSEEIFELNRHVLSDPELLPIGAELVIPPRNDRAVRNLDAPQSFISSGDATRSATRGLIPVRPIPAGGTVSPRAQLSRPLPAE